MIRLNILALSLSYEIDGFSGLEKIPAMQRRRLSGIAKLAINNVIQCLDSQKVDYIVWSSQYGDEEKTLKILQDVLLDQIPSPTLFSTSVHNAVAGLYSIFCTDDTPSTSLAASWTEALIEGYAFLKTQAKAKTALIVYYDQRLPTIYQEFQNMQAFSMSAIISLEHPNLMIDDEHIETPIYKFKDAMDFYTFWEKEEGTSNNVWSKCSA